MRSQGGLAEDRPCDGSCGWNLFSCNGNRFEGLGPGNKIGSLISMTTPGALSKGRSGGWESRQKPVPIIGALKSIAVTRAAFPKLQGYQSVLLALKVDWQI